MKQQPFRLTPAVLLAGLALVSVTIAPVMAAGAINHEMTSHHPATTAPQSISHGTFHYLHPAVILGWKWWHYLLAVVGVVVVVTVFPAIWSSVLGPVFEPL